MMKCNNILKEMFVRKTEWVHMIVGHCEKGNYLVVPDVIFGTNTIYLNDDQFEFQLLGILKRSMEKVIITKDTIDKFNSNPFDHIINHHSNGRHIVKYHRVSHEVWIDRLNDEALAQYESVVDYIKTKQKWHDEKNHLHWANSLTDDQRGVYHGIGKQGQLDHMRLKYEELRMEYIRSRILAKHNCKTKERFESMLRFYWQQHNIKEV